MVVSVLHGRTTGGNNVLRMEIYPPLYLWSAGKFVTDRRRQVVIDTLSFRRV